MSSVSSGEIVLPRVFHLVGVRADGSQRRICSVSTRFVAETMKRLLGPFNGFRQVEIVEGEWSP